MSCLSAVKYYAANSPRYFSSAEKIAYTSLEGYRNNSSHTHALFGHPKAGKKQVIASEAL